MLNIVSGPHGFNEMTAKKLQQSFQKKHNLYILLILAHFSKQE